MESSERSLSTLGRRVAELQDREPAARLDRERGRARLLDAPPEVAPRPVPRGLRLAGLLAAAALLAGVLFVVLAMRPRAPLQFELGATEPGVVGDWIAAPADAEVPIRFSDGTLLRLAPGGRARVASVDARGAVIALERGALDAAVIHRDGARWTVRVGPFQVHVIGTRFETSWDPMTEVFEVALREGSILLTGPVVGDARTVRPGERLTVSTASSSLEVGSIEPAPAEFTEIDSPVGRPADTASEGAISTALASAPSPAQAPGADALPSTPRARASVATSAEPRREQRAPWRALALEGRYKDAVAAAELEGFDEICAAGSAADLHALGDAARLGGSPARAGQALIALRKRFAGSGEAAEAAFILGRIAQDQTKDSATAVRWFERYLSEQPGGPFAADAAGRLVEAANEMGDQSAARRAAERYLAAFPNGSHAAYAKSVLARGSTP